MAEDYSKVQGRIFNIQRYSIHDGPGIRSIVFFKGCPLRCRWCCNPESQSREIQTMYEKDKKDIVGRDVSVREILDEVRLDMPYYRRSGGGVTLSGGEAFFQPDFAKAVLEGCKDNGINTAVETTGFVPFENIEKSLPYLDYVLMDIKHMNSEKHRLFTGGGNEQILKNADKIANMHINLTIRVPVIPTFNDTEEEISAIAEFASSLPGVSKLHLLPYHRLGEDKYKRLSREYAMQGIPLLSDEKIQLLFRAALKHGIDCQIGG